MDDKISRLIEEIEQTEIKLREESPKNIGKNLSRYLKLKERYNRLTR